MYGYYDMVRCMKTTVEINDVLLREVKRLALRERTTLRSLMEQGLRLIVSKRNPGGRFALREASVGGDGLARGVSLRDWDAVRDAIYSERGA